MLLETWISCEPYTRLTSMGLLYIYGFTLPLHVHGPLSCAICCLVIYLHRQAACWLPLSVTIRPKVGVHHATTHAINSHITPNGSMNL